MPWTYRNRRQDRGPQLSGRIANDRLQYWTDEEEEPADAYPVQMGFPLWLTLPLVFGAVLVAAHALKR